MTAASGGRIAVLGDPARLAPWSLAGAIVVAVDPGDPAAGWEALPPSVEVVVLTREVAAAVGQRSGGPLRVVLP